MSAEPPLLPDAHELFEGAPCGLLVTREDGTLLRTNPTFCNWIGFSEAELLGRRFQDLLTVGGRIFHQTHWAPLMQIQGAVTEVKLELLHREHHTVTMLLNGVRREHPGGVFYELALFGTADRDKYERELLNARKLAEQMVAIVSHDLKNPLTAIKMASDMLLRGERSAKESRLLGHIGQSAERAQRMIADLLDFALARVGQGIGVSPIVLNVHDVIGECVNELRVAFPQARLVHQASGEGTVCLDGDRMQQLLGNLVANAVAYGDTSRPITVVTGVADGRASIGVHNDGPVIPESLFAALFEPMNRCSQFDSQVRSVGLGLFIVKKIAEAHGGSVSVSSAQGQGTTFSVSLPVGAGLVGDGS